MPAPIETDGVFASVERRRATVRKARVKTVLALGLGGVGLAAAYYALPHVMIRGLRTPLIVPLAWCSIGVGALYCAGTAVVRLATGKYRSGRTDFGLPKGRRVRGSRRRPLP